jgi:hypothetical protein
MKQHGSIIKGMKDSIENNSMSVDYNGYIANQEFHEFLDREFDLVARNSSVEELADFAFGSMEVAIRTFEERKKKLK